jgi:hypothetical protein
MYLTFRDEFQELPVSDNQCVVLYSLSPQSAYILENDNLFTYVCTPQPPVRQYLWYPASAAVDDTTAHFTSLIF